MGNLRASSVNPGDPRPFQKGEVEGVKQGRTKKAVKEWLVDTGANISALTKDNAEQFDLIPLGGSASATTGGGGILIKMGLTMVFTVLEASGANRTVRCSLPIGVKPNNNGSEILGMDQLASIPAKIRWDPSVQDEDIYE
jgi:hypothetical protein